MSSYSDRLSAEFDEITEGVVAVLERAATEDRELTADEQTQIDRDDARREDLAKAIEHYAGIADRTAKVNAVRDRVSALPSRQTVAVRDEPYDITREFPSAGHYAATVHAAWVNKDPDAIAKLERATAHQTTDDNPGIIPRPIVGPLINTLSGDRPLLASVPNRVAPAGKFDRPRVDQHVEVAKQTAEKAETASQEMIIGEVPVALDTYAGHLNISKQNIRWSQPSILQVVFDDFVRIYGRRTDDAATTEFPTLVTQTQPLAAYDYASVRGFLIGAQAQIVQNADDATADTLWMSLDVWQGLGGITMPVTDNPAFNLPLTATGGDVLGFNAVLDRHFPDGTLILGDRSLAECWEDLEGFLSVDEPSVLGQLVGYAGYMDFVVLQPKAFVKATGLPVGTQASAPSSTSSGK